MIQPAMKLMNIACLARTICKEPVLIHKSGSASLSVQRTLLHANLQRNYNCPTVVPDDDECYNRTSFKCVEDRAYARNSVLNVTRSFESIPFRRNGDTRMK